MEQPIGLEWREALRSEARALGVELSEEGALKVAGHVSLLLKWNTKINLTRITQPDDIRIKHALDSLGALPIVPASISTVLDLGAGAGFPGIPWMCARPKLRVTLIDSVAKKVGFLKAALAQLRLEGRALHVRVEGAPTSEGVSLVDLVVSRAFTELERLLPLARPYLNPGGRVLSMLGPRESLGDAQRIAEGAGYGIESHRQFDLPAGAGFRQVLLLVPRETPKSAV